MTEWGMIMIERSPTPHAATRTSGWAAASLACALANFVVLPVVGAVLAIVFDIVAIREIDASGGQLRGRGMVEWALPIGIAGLVLYAALTLMMARPAPMFMPHL